MSQTPDDSVLLLTCSMPRDKALAELLFRSVDALVAEDIRHLVVVPGDAVAEFRPFANSRREIVVQEDLLPYRTYKLPSVGWLAPLVPPLRRPLYVTPSLRMVRGWVLQQALKFEASRTASERAVMHVDSDVFFVRPMVRADVHGPEGPHFFRAEGETANPLHRPWLDAAAGILGLDVPAGHRGHYVENCLVWSTDIVRDIFARVEAVHGRSLHDLLLRQRTFSEYYIYGAWVDLAPGPKAVHPSQTPLCNTFWPEAGDGHFNLDNLRARFRPEHRAMAVQSTYPFTIQQRTDLYEAARTGLAG